MAATDTVLVKKTIIQTIAGVGSTTTKGVAEEVPMSQFAAVIGVATAAGSSGTVIRTTAPAAAPAAFADLTAAATAYNAMRTALIAAGVLI